MGRRARMNTRKRNRRIILISIAVAIVAVSVALALLISSSFGCGGNCSYINQPVSSSVYQEITGVSSSVLSAIGGPTNVATPATASGTLLTSNGKPEVLYIGGEYCPYCAVERWALIQALSHFGSFTGLEYMLSSSTDINPNSPTFTFAGKSFNYTSQYFTFVPVEEYNRTSESTVWHALTTQESSIFSQYGSGGFPFVDIANQFIVNGVQSPIDIGGQNWTAVAGQLSNSGSTVAQAIDGAANKLTAAMCKVDGGVPASVCTESYASVTLSYASSGSGSSSLAIASAVSVRPASEKPRWIV